MEHMVSKYEKTLYTSSCHELAGSHRPIMQRQCVENLWNI